MNNKYKIIGKNLKFLRTNLKLKQNEVANYLGIKREMLSYYENENRKPSIDILNRLCDLYGIELKDLFEEKADSLMLKIALSFRAENLNEEDLEIISYFRKIVKNYLKMIKLENRDE